MNITGTFYSWAHTSVIVTGAFTKSGGDYRYGLKDDGQNGHVAYGFDASRSWTGKNKKTCKIYLKTLA